MRYVNISSACWNNGDVRGSGYLRVWCKALSIGASSQVRKVSCRTANCRQKSGLYNCLFCFQVGVYHQRPLIYSSTTNSIHFCFLLPQQWISESATRRGIGCLYTTSGATATIGLRPHSSLITHAFYPLPGRRLPFSPHKIHMSSLPKLAQNFPFLQGWFFLRPAACTSCNLLFPAHHLFWLVISPILAFIYLFFSRLEKSISTLW